MGGSRRGSWGSRRGSLCSSQRLLQSHSTHHWLQYIRCAVDQHPHPHDAEDLARRGNRGLHLLHVARLARRHKHGSVLQGRTWVQARRQRGCRRGDRG